MINKESLQMLWQLYSDAAIRSNLLVDECAHLQTTIQAHLAHVQPDIFAIEQSKNGEEPLQERPWCTGILKSRDFSYYELQPQNRALVNLFETVGALALAIEKNTKTLRHYFDRVLAAANGAAGMTEAVYWFIALRGHYLGSTYDYYLEHIEHAQEKIIQLLENMPGSLPGPTLMRRWSSGGYGEFLSNYSRQVHRETQWWTWEFCSLKNDLSDDSFDTWRANQLFVHTWSHDSTSTTTRHKITFSEKPNDFVHSPRVKILVASIDPGCS